MGNEKSKNCLSCTNENFFVDCSPPPPVQKPTWSDNHEAPKPKSSPNMNKTPVNGDSPLTSFSVSDASTFGLEDSDGVLAPKRPHLKNNNSSSENMSSQLSVLVEAENETTERTLVNAKEHEYVDVPPMVADLIKPENARKNVMDTFEVIQTLGDGMSSSVFEVRHVVTDQRYALKRLRVCSGCVMFFFALESINFYSFQKIKTLGFLLTNPIPVLFLLNDITL
ncbi:hypothetical protein RFI_11982, partial [Reticulomyxa filosa]